MSLLEDIRAAVIEGDAKTTTAKIEAALAEGADPNTLLQDGLISGMQEVGRLFEESEIFVPEMLIAAQGDIHDIGKSLVIMMWEGAGFEVKDLGIDVPPERFIEAANEGYDIIGMSALLTTTMPNIRTTIEAMQAAGVRDKVMIIIGGAPVTQTYADEVGANGYAPDAASAARKAKAMIESKGG